MVSSTLTVAKRQTWPRWMRRSTLSLVFFQASYNLRDYLLRYEAATKTQLDELMEASPAMQACRDVCNGAKHGRISRPSVDAEPWIIREYHPDDPNGWRLRVKAGGMFDLVDLASQCMREWDDFLRTRSWTQLHSAPPRRNSWPHCTTMLHFPNLTPHPDKPIPMEQFSLSWRQDLRPCVE